MKHLKSLRFAAHTLLLLLLAASLNAATVTTKYVILFDVDNSSATGCTYTVGTTSIQGIEHVLTTTVDRNGSSATVTKVERQQCTGGTFSAPITVDSTGWPALIGSDGALHVVTHIPDSVFGTTVPLNMRLYIGVQEGLGATFIETAPNGSPILYPTMGPRHRAVVHDGTPEEPITPVLDGSFAMFNGLPPMFLGPPVVTGTPLQSISTVFGFTGVTDLYFLINIGGNGTGTVVANPDSYTLQQGHGIGAGAPGVLTNDVNTTGSPMLAQLLTSTHLGTLTLNADGSFHYNNNGGPQTTDTFTYKATAGGQTSDPATVTFHMTPDNPPIGVTDSYNVAHHGTLNVPPPGVLINDSDPDHDPITAVLNTPPLHASNFHLNSNGSFTYTHDGSNTLADSFTYRATDGIIPSLPVTVNITIGPDTAPVAVGDSYTITEGGTLSVTAPGVLTNDTDANNDTLTAVIVTPPAHATSFTLNADGSFTYVHDDSGIAPDSFTYKASDGILTSNTVTVSITITCPTITVTNPSTTTGTASTPFSQTFTQSGANATKVFSTTSTLPAGLTLSAAGVLSGTPTQTGTFPIVVKVAETSGCFGTSATYNLVIGCQTINVTNPATSTGVAAAAFSQTFSQSGAIGTATFSTASTLPTGLTLSSAGVLSGTPTQTGSFPIVVTVTDSNGCVGTGATYTLVITCQTISVTNPATTTGTANAAFSQTFTQSGAIGTATFTTSSTLPTGLTLSSGGVLSGTPLVVGSFPIVVTVTDSNGCSGSGSTYTLVISCQTITVTNPATTTGTASSAFSQTFTAGNTIGAVTFTTASTLPAGLSLSSGGVLSGTPTQTGTFPIVVTATDANGCSGSGSTYTLVINCQTISVTNPANTTGTVSATFSEQFNQSGSIGTATFTTASTLPNGLTLSTSGLLSGTPTQIGTFPIVVTVTDSNGCTGTSATYTLVINCQIITVNNPSSNSVPAGTALTAANFTFTQSGAVGGATFTTASTLPTGVTLTTAGVLTGTPTQGGSFPITVTVTDGNGCTGSSSGYTLTVVCPVITVTNPGVTSGTVNIAFSQTFTQSGGIGTTTFSTASTLPAGLSLSSGGVLSGTPTQSGTFPIVVTATDSNGCTGSGSTYTLVIACQVISVTNPVTNTGTVNTAFSQSFSASNTIGTVTYTTSSILPTGLSLAANGTLSGTPTQKGTFGIVVTATDANSCSGNSSTYSLTIGCQVITVTNPAVTTGTASSAFSQTFTASNTIGTVTFTTASTLPNGISLSPIGVLSGTPTQTGTFPIVVMATDANGCTGTSSTYTLVIGCQTISVTNPSNTTGTVSATFSEQFSQSGAIGTATFSTASTLPTGLTLHSATGILDGTPTQSGTFPIVVTVTDSNGCTGTSATYTLVINCQIISVTNPSSNSVPAGTALVAANFTFTQSGAVGGATFTTASTLPTGVTLTTGGVLTGTPTQGGTFPITVTVTDGNGCTGTSSGYTLTVVCPVITVTNPGVTSGTVNIAFSQTFTQSGGVGTTTFSTASTLPTGLTLNSSTGVLSGTPTVPGTFPIVVTATDSNGCTGSGSTYTLVIACQVISVTNPVTNTGTVDAAFSQTFTASNTIGTVTFTTSSTLPAGLTLATNGTLSGTPTQKGTFPIVVTATDANGCTGNSATYTLTINCQTITVTIPVPNTGTVDAAFSQTFTQSGAHGTATFTTASPLPPGMSLSPGGVLSGTPTQPGSYPIVVVVTDANGCTGTSSTYTLTVNCQTITVNIPVPNGGIVNASFSQTFTQSGAHGTATFTTASTLPNGMSLSPGGVLSGTPTQPGTFPIVVTVTDANGCTGTSPVYNLIISCQTISVTNPANTSGTVASFFSETFTQSGGFGTTNFTTASTLPAGLTLHASTGVLDGTPTQSGTFPIVVRATDSNGCFGDGATYTLVIACNVISVTNPSTTTGTAGSLFSQTFTQSGGNGTITWSETGALPAGITLNTSTGLLSGTTSVTGSFPITVTATDANGCQGTGATFTLVISCQTISITNATSTTVQAGTALSPAANWTFTASGILGTATWSKTGTLPTGITLNAATGVLSGTTNQLGSFPITVTVTDTNGCFGTSSYTLTVTCPTITVARTGGGSFPAGSFNVAYAGQSVVASGGGGTYTYAVTAGALPTGLSLSSGGAISGTPSATGTFSFTVTATDTATSCTGSQAFSITINPSAGSDSYSNLVANTEAVVTGGSTTSPATPFVGLTGTIISNDLPSGGVAVQAGTTSTAQGGSVTIAADGTFKYTPPVTVAALTSDSFTYVINSDTGGTGTPGTATGTVTLNLAGRVWYVKNNAAGGGDGRSHLPFNSLANFTNGARSTPDKTGDIIFIYNGDGTTTNLNAAVALLTNEQLVGEGVALVVNGNTLVAAGTKPQITNTTGDAVTLANGNTLKGITVTGASGNNITGTNIAGLTMDTMTSTAATGVGSSALILTNSSGAVTITNTTLSATATELQLINGTPTFTMNNTNTITANAGQRSVAISGLGGTAVVTLGAGITDNGVGISVSTLASGAQVSFTGSQTLGTTIQNGVTLTSNNAASTVSFSGTLNITTSSGTGINATGGGTLNVSGTANVTTGAAIYGINLDSITVGASGVTFNSINTNGATTAGINLVNFAAAGTVTVNGGTIQNGATGVNLQGTNTSLTLAGVTITGPTTGIKNTTNFGKLTIGSSVSVSAATAINLTTGTVKGTFTNVSSTGGTNGVNLNAVTVDAAGFGASAGTLTGATGATFNVAGGSGGTITWAGAITQANAANAVTIAGGNSNTINFGGNVTSQTAATGVTLTASSGTYNFNGTNAFSGTGGGILISNGESGTISFSSNTTNTETGTANFQVDGSVSAVTAAITYSGTINRSGSVGRIIDVNKLNNPGTLTMTHAPAASGNLAGNFNGAPSTASGISIINSSSTNITVANATLAYKNTDAVTLNGNTGATITLNGLSVTNNGSGKGMVLIGGGTVSVGTGAAASAINVSAGTGIGIDGTASAFTGTLNLNSVTITGNGATAVTLGGGTLGGTASIITNSGPALVLSSVALTNGAGMTSITSTGGANGISLTSCTGGTYTVSGGALSGNSGSTFLVSGGSTTFVFNGTLAQSNAQRIVNISGITGGGITLGGTVTGSTSCTGITAGGSAGTVSIGGVITLNGAADSFTASGSGTFTIVANATTNTIGSTTNVNPGPAVSISSATIGASGVKFQSIKSNAGVNGIALSNTGSSGSFSITANGGTCSTSANCTGGFITNATGAGITMTNTLSPSFDRMFIQNTAKSGVSGTQVQNFTLTNSTIDNSGTDHATPTDDSNVSFGFGVAGTEKNVYGTVIISGNTLTNSYQHGVFIQNYDGTITDAQIQNNTITSSNVIANSNGSGIQLLGNGSASTVSGVTKAEITGNTVNNFPSGAGITAQFGNPSGANGTWGTPGTGNVILIQSNKITGDSTNKMNTNAILATMTGNGNAYWKIDSNGTVANPLTNMKGAAIGVTTRATSAATSNTQADISNNVIVANNVLGSQGIAVGITNVAGATTDAPNLSANITNNTVGSTSGQGIDAIATGCSGLLKLKIQNNTVTAPTQASTFAIEPRQGSTAAGGAPTLCVNITGNTATGNATTGIGIRKQSGQTWAFGVDSLPGGSTATPNFESYINSVNPAGGGTTLVSATSGFSTCSNP